MVDGHPGRRSRMQVTGDRWQVEMEGGCRGDGALDLPSPRMGAAYRPIAFSSGNSSDAVSKPPMTDELVGGEREGAAVDGRTAVSESHLRMGGRSGQNHDDNEIVVVVWWVCSKQQQRQQ